MRCAIGIWKLTKDEISKRTRAAVLSLVMNNAMRLLHPIAPFITEEVWLSIPHDGATIMTASWPDPEEIPADRQAAVVFEQLQATVERLRNLRAELGLQPRERMTLDVPAELPVEVTSLLGLLASGDIPPVPFDAPGSRHAAPVPSDVGPLLAQVQGVAPKGVLQERYKKEAERLAAEVARGEGKLANSQFVANAKPDVVAKEREKLQEYRTQLCARSNRAGGDNRTMTATAAKRRVLIGSDEIDRILARLAHQILEPQDAQNSLYLIGIRRGGETVAQRLADQIERISGRRPPLGFLNINLYRDDEVSHDLPDSQIPTDVAGKTVVVIDDVLYTGRTVRSALDAVTDLGRPSAVRLCVLVDRGLRELPVQPDYVGRFIPTSRRERVIVNVHAKSQAGDEVAVVADET